MSLKQVVAPTLQPITLAEAKLHLRVDSADDDALITALIDAATQDAEHVMKRAVLPQQWKLTIDSFMTDSRVPAQVAYASTQWLGPTQSTISGFVLLQVPTVTAVDSVKYIAATTGLQTTLANTEYLVDLGSDYVARLCPAYGKNWPSVRNQLAAVEILFTSGWPDVASVPSLVKQWIKLRIGGLYENREAWTLHKQIQPNPFVDFMLDRYRAWMV